ncbi:MAG: aminopeptidase P family protein [Sphingopyxis sp.]|nr:aminopeptidase P family protein [Sphingopyxis sp.]
MTMSNYFPREEYEARWKRVWDAMRAKGYEHLLVWSRGAGSYDRLGNGLWLTNFANTGTGQDWADDVQMGAWTFSAVLFRDGRAPELHAAQPPGETEYARTVCGELIVHEPSVVTGLAEYFRKHGIEGRVAVVGDDVLPGLYDRKLRSLTPQIKWVTDEWFLLEPQRVKSEREQEAFRTAGDITTHALAAGMDALIAGETSAEAAARTAMEIIRRGGCFTRIDMHHGPRTEKFLLGDMLTGYDMTAPTKGDMVRGWIQGPIFQGYWLDPGRTAVCGGKPTKEQRHILEGATDVCNSIIKAIRPGVTARQLGALGKTVAERYAGENIDVNSGIFGHQMGTFYGPHIIPAGDPGTLDDEAEKQGRSAAERMFTEFEKIDEPYEPGMLIAVEAFMHHHGVGLSGLEDHVLVTKDGCEQITKTPFYL